MWGGHSHIFSVSSLHLFLSPPLLALLEEGRREGEREVEREGGREEITEGGGEEGGHRKFMFPEVW